ncbi:MAG: methyltransferase [Candidatus Lokiarchaeota archaeon]|nr:methyltransferase [Candidatus Lokiarchaeota archaeon]
MVKIPEIKDPIIKACNEALYYPSDDSYLLIDYFYSHTTPESFDGIKLEFINNILDMGTGTGIIALSFLYLKQEYQNLNPHIYASDVLESAIKCARINEKANNFQEEITFILSDLFSNFPSSLKNSFDVIVFNPPYLPSSDLLNETKKNDKDLCWDGGNTGIEILGDFITQLKDFLHQESSKNARSYFISSSRTDSNKIDKIVEKNELKREILCKKRFFFEDLFLNRLEMFSI